MHKRDREGGKLAIYSNVSQTAHVLLQAGAGHTRAQQATIRAASGAHRPEHPAHAYQPRTPQHIDDLLHQAGMVGYAASPGGFSGKQSQVGPVKLAHLSPLWQLHARHCCPGMQGGAYLWQHGLWQASFAHGCGRAGLTLSQVVPCHDLCDSLGQIHQLDAARHEIDTALATSSALESTGISSTPGRHSLYS